MTLQHYLPAAYLARFSRDENYPLRKRTIFVGEKITGRIFSTSVEKLAVRKNFYSVSKQSTKNDNDFIDKVWSGFEKDLNGAIDKLINYDLDAITWLRTLVPFAASFLVRGIDFDKRFSNRMQQLFQGNSEDFIESAKSPDNINHARLFELQLLLAPVIASRWSVCQTQGIDSLITNDIGYLPCFDLLNRVNGVAIPLDLCHVLVLSPQKKRNIVVSVNGKWRPLIEYGVLKENNHHSYIETSVRYADRFIFGDTEDIIRRYLSNESVDLNWLANVQQGFFQGSLVAHAHEFTWYYLLTALSKSPESIGSHDFREIDWKLISSEWHPIPILPFNLPNFPPTLAFDGESINICLYNVQEHGEDFLIPINQLIYKKKK
jgi:hypothetical protein